VFWNQVDSFVAVETTAAVADRFVRVALLFAMHASQTFEFLEDRSTRFPFEIHGQNLQTVQRIWPRMVVPGSAGFRFCGQAAALNPFLFPISRERFLARRSRQACPLVRTSTDIFVIGDTAFAHDAPGQPLPGRGSPLSPSSKEAMWPRPSRRM
jgi:hypothetical protein